MRAAGAPRLAPAVLRARPWRATCLGPLLWHVRGCFHPTCPTTALLALTGAAPARCPPARCPCPPAAAGCLRGSTQQRAAGRASSQACRCHQRAQRRAACRGAAAPAAARRERAPCISAPQRGSPKRRRAAAPLTLEGVVELLIQKPIDDGLDVARHGVARAQVDGVLIDRVKRHVRALQDVEAAAHVAGAERDERVHAAGAHVDAGRRGRGGGGGAGRAGRGRDERAALAASACWRQRLGFDAIWWRVDRQPSWPLAPATCPRAPRQPRAAAPAIAARLHAAPLPSPRPQPLPLLTPPAAPRAPAGSARARGRAAGSGSACSGSAARG